MRAKFEAPGSLPQNRSIAIAAFTGWCDAGYATSNAVQHLLDLWDSELIFEITEEEYYDYSSSRPGIRINEGVQQIVWPRTEIHRAMTPDGRTVHIIIGAEPDLRWQQYCAKLLESLDVLGVDTIVTLTATPHAEPHSRPARVQITSHSLLMQDSLGVPASDYQGPASITHALQLAAVQARIADISLWTGVPGYIHGQPWPASTVSVIGALASILDIPIPTDDLTTEADQWFNIVDEMVQVDDDISDYIRQLEDDYDQDAITEVSGELLAQDFERYLRKRFK